MIKGSFAVAEMNKHTKEKVIYGVTNLVGCYFKFRFRLLESKSNIKNTQNDRLYKFLN